MESCWRKYVTRDGFTEFIALLSHYLTFSASWSGSLSPWLPGHDRLSSGTTNQNELFLHKVTFGHGVFSQQQKITDISPGCDPEKSWILPVTLVSLSVGGVSPSLFPIPGSLILKTESHHHPLPYRRILSVCTATVATEARESRRTLHADWESCH